jgi:hypothetical protein
MGLEAATLDPHVAPYRRDFVEAMIQLIGL